jgi:hypothetical protein
MSRRARVVDPRFGELLTTLRKAHGLTYDQLSARVHYSPSYLNEVAKGHQPPSPELAGALDKALDAFGSLIELAPPRSTNVASSAVEVTSPATGATPDSNDAGQLMRAVRGADLDELVKVVSMWARDVASADRRRVLCNLSAALVAAAAAPAFDADVLDPDKRRHLAGVLSDSAGRFDETALRYCEGMVLNLCRQVDILGPNITLQSVMSHRQIASQLAKAAPSSARQRAVSVYAEYSRLMGWLYFNLADPDSGMYYYEDARDAAHEAHNVELVAFVLCAMSQLSTWRGKPRIGIDHAAAAAVWADRSNSPFARAYATDVAVRAFIADSQVDHCRTALDLERSQVVGNDQAAPMSRLWYFYDESFYWRTEGEFHLKVGDPSTAIAALDKSLGLSDPAHLHNNSFRRLFLAEARIQQGEPVEACTLIGDVADLTAVGRSPRTSRRLADLRAALAPWENTEAVRELDQRLGSSGNTSRAYSL